LRCIIHQNWNIYIKFKSIVNLAGQWTALRLDWNLKVCLEVRICQCPTQTWHCHITCDDIELCNFLKLLLLPRQCMCRIRCSCFIVVKLQTCAWKGPNRLPSAGTISLFSYSYEYSSVGGGKNVLPVACGKVMDWEN